MKHVMLTGISLSSHVSLRLQNTRAVVVEGQRNWCVQLYGPEKQEFTVSVWLAGTLNGWITLHDIALQRWHAGANLPLQTRLYPPWHLDSPQTGITAWHACLWMHKMWRVSRLQPSNGCCCCLLLIWKCDKQCHPMDCRRQCTWILFYDVSARQRNYLDHFEEWNTKKQLLWLWNGSNHR